LQSKQGRESLKSDETEQDDGSVSPPLDNPAHCKPATKIHPTRYKSEEQQGNRGDKRNTLLSGLAFPQRGRRSLWLPSDLGKQRTNERKGNRGQSRRVLVRQECARTHVVEFLFSLAPGTRTQLSRLEQQTAANSTYNHKDLDSGLRSGLSQEIARYA